MLGVFNLLLYDLCTLISQEKNEPNTLPTTASDLMVQVIKVQ